MRATRAFSTLMTTLLSIVVGGAIAYADEAPTGDSSHGRDGDAVVIHAGGQAAGDRADGPDQATTMTVACSGDTTVSLQRIGVGLPAETAATCRDQGAACAQLQRADRTKRAAVVNLDRAPNGDWQYAGNECVGNGPAGVTPELVRQQAVRLIPTATVGLAPRGTTLVNIETVMWADAPRQRELAPVTILGQRVVVRIVLDHVAWRFGDGETVANGPAGKAYSQKTDPCREKTCKDYFGHVYRKTGTVTVSAAATWHASFSVAGGGPVDIPGTVDGPASQANIVVKQARAVLVPNPGDQP